MGVVVEADDTRITNPIILAVNAEAVRMLATPIEGNPQAERFTFSSSYIFEGGAAVEEGAGLPSTV